MFKSPLHEIVERFSTNFWVHSCTEIEIDYALNHGATGVSISLEFLQENFIRNKNNNEEIIDKKFKKDLDEIIKTNIDSVSKYTIKKISNKLSDIYHNSLGEKGRVSISGLQIDYDKHREILDRGIEFKDVTSNIYIEIPASTSGVKIIEEAILLGLSINATHIYSVSQVQQIISSVQRGIKRRVDMGKDVTMIHVICTVNNEKLKKQIKKIQANVNQQTQNLICLYIVKSIYKEISQNGFIIDLNIEFYKYDDIWMKYIGGDLTLTFTYEMIKMINDMKIEVHDYMHNTNEKDFSKITNCDGLKELYGANRLDLAGIDKFFNESTKKK